MPDHLRGLPLGAIALLALLSGGCLDNTGITPPGREFNFPIAGRLWPADAPTHLLVANTNFDLRYNGGTLSTWSLTRLDECLLTCSEMGIAGEDCYVTDIIRPGSDEVACPGLFKSEVIIDSFAADIALSPAGDRVYVPVRSSSELFQVELASDGTLSCGPDRRCDDSHQGVDDSVAREQGMTLPVDPVGIYVGSASADLGLPEGSGDYVLLSHREGAASLLSAGTPGTQASLIDVRKDFAPNLASISRDPNSGLMWIPSASRPAIDRVGVAADDRSILSESFLYDAGSLPLRGIDTGAAGYGDARQVVFDPRGLHQAYVLSRQPRALFIVAPDESQDGVELRGEVDVGSGPSRVTVAVLRAGTPAEHTLAFVSCFDSRDVYIIDVDAPRLVSVYRGVSGPFDLAVDPVTEQLYITDFRASVIRVVDITPTLDCLAGTASGECTPRQLGMLGRPRAIVELR